MVAATERVQVIRCGIGDEVYCLEMTSVSGVRQADGLRRNPDSEADGLLGWTATSQAEVAVYSLAHLLGRRSGGAQQHLVLLNGNSDPWALMVEKVSQVISVPPERISPVPRFLSGPTTPIFKGIVDFTRDPMTDHIRAPVKRMLGISFEPQPQRERRWTNHQIHLLLEPDHLSPDAASAPPATATNHRPLLGPRLVGSPQIAGSSPGRIITFSVSDTLLSEKACSFALSISQVLEVVEPLPIIPVPASPSYLLGCVHWRGHPVPVIDLAKRLRLPSLGISGKTSLLIVRGNNDVERVGFHVQSEIHVKRLPLKCEPCEPPAELAQELTHGTFELPSETLVVPDVQRILSCP